MACQVQWQKQVAGPQCSSAYPFWLDRVPRGPPPSYHPQSSGRTPPQLSLLVTLQQTPLSMQVWVAMVPRFYHSVWGPWPLPR